MIYGDHMDEVDKVMVYRVRVPDGQRGMNGAHRTATAPEGLNDVTDVFAPQQGDVVYVSRPKATKMCFGPMGSGEKQFYLQLPLNFSIAGTPFQLER